MSDIIIALSGEIKNEIWEDGQLVYGSFLLKDEIFPESIKQVDKWGIQKRTPEEWMLFLTEEVGELAQSIAEHKYRGGSREHIIEEATQVTALAMKILEMNIIIRERGKKDISGSRDLKEGC